MALLISYVTWFSIIQGLSLCCYPFLQEGLKERVVSYALSKALGLFFFGFIVWVVGLLGVPVTVPTLGLLLLITFAGTYLFSTTRYGSWERIPYPAKNEVKNIEFLFLGTFLFFYLLQCIHPEIFWGEKPMDFTFLNFFSRSSVIPPQDPWASGNTMRYYYFGPFVLGLLHKLSGMPPAIGYGVSIATIAALFVVSMFSVMYVLTASIESSTIASLLIATLGTFDTLYVRRIKHLPYGFDLFWATSRTFKSPGINEYSLWTTLFADLHAHFIAFPVVASLICLSGLLVRALRQQWETKAITPLLIITGTVWGMLAPLNTWDLINFGIVLAILFLFFIFTPEREILLKSRIRTAGLGLITVAIALIISIPFHLTVSSNANIGKGFVYPEESNGFSEFFRIHGHWFLLSIIGLLGTFKRGPQNVSQRKAIFVLAFGLVPALLARYQDISILQETQKFFVGDPYVFGPWWGPVLFTTVICFVGSILFVQEESHKKEIGVLLYVSGILLTLLELYYLMDRMNTTFKVNNSVWPIFGAASLALVIPFFERTYRSWKLNERHSLGMNSYVAACSSLVLLPCIIASTLLIWMMCSFQRITTDPSPPRPTIDGTAYLTLLNPSEKIAFDWINRHIFGTPVLLEAFGPSYQSYARFSMNTGLPIVLGWRYHVEQRGTKDGEQRENDVRNIYTTSSLKTALRLLNKYRVDLIIVGSLERERYGVSGLSKFSDNPKDFPLLFQTGSGEHEVKIYTTRYSSYYR